MEYPAQHYGKHFHFTMLQSVLRTGVYRETFPTFLPSRHLGAWVGNDVFLSFPCIITLSPPVDRHWLFKDESDNANSSAM